jgi:hypothetical protein
LCGPPGIGDWLPEILVVKWLATDRHQYLLLLAGCVVLTVPLEFVFSAGVYRRWERTVRTLAVPVVVFTEWDLIAVRAGDWTLTLAS